MRTLRTFFPLLLAASMLSACEGLYQVTFNERVVYDPFGEPPEDGLLNDPNLQGCMNELLNRNEEMTPETIKLLACTGAGISSLFGIHALESLEQLELSDNSVSDLSPLTELSNLRVLSLRNNDVRDVRPLMNLRLLRFVSLQGNERIPCRQLDQLAERVGSGLTRPVSCAR